MAEMKGSKTEQNLLKAFAGESQAKNRYEFAAKQADKEGFLQIGDLFRATAMQEQMHAKRFYSFLEGGVVEITAGYPAGQTLTTVENLKAAAAGENEEWTELYPHFATVAQEEGFPEVANTFKMVARAEAEHEQRYLDLMKNIEEGKVFEREEKVDWQCRKCGYVHNGKKAPAKCPCCLHEQRHFELKQNNF